MPEELSPESKLYVKEELEKVRNEFKGDLKEAQSKATKIFSAVAMTIGLVTGVSVFLSISNAIHEEIKTQAYEDLRSEAQGYVNDACDLHAKIIVYEKEANNIWENLSKREKIMHLPIGTIVASMLDPNSFAKEVGDPNVFNPNKSGWALADGREVKDSQYSRLLDEPKIPDLRGVFLRGMNEGRNDGKQDPNEVRKVGQYQADALQQHYHNTNALTIQWQEAGKPWKEGQGIRQNPNNKIAGSIVTGVTEARPDVETRPKNVAVYFYIKIN